MDTDIASATVSVVDLTDNDLLLSGLSKSVTHEMVDEDLINHVLDGGVQLCGQEMINEDSINYISDGEVEFPGQEMVNRDATYGDAPQIWGRCTSLQ